MNQKTTENYLIIARYFTAVCILVTLFISYRLWLPDESFPLIPAIDALPVLPASISKIALVLLAFSLLPFSFKPDMLLFVAIACLFGVLIQTDINRLQPTYYIFLLILLCQVSRKHPQTLMILLFAGIYFWSGTHKFNAYFLEKWLGGLDKRIPFVPREFRIAFTYAVPFIEAAAGLMLLRLKTRRFASIVLVVMHLIIIATLVKETGGYNVIPLNFLMISILLLVIYRSDVSIFYGFDFKKGAILATAWLLPTLNLFGWYDHFLSFSIMSGKPVYAAIYFNDKKIIEKLPTEAKPFLRQKDGQDYILLSEWAGTNKKIMIYPEKRVYKKLENYLVGNDTDMVSLIEYRP
ncbi:MAG: hypothetical protein EOO50_01850 [Flavobacterium sp.]|uniref:MauE/DoxX family redox-associated membrane protein n=1 Tax=Flavobacterium sp. TaxID=239 RepID=UPI0011FBCDC6|nr:MauE/DoxX family redox-associated membrane protein [Flavobacterium sp.]RZJ68185.1 MAG: hypothetical protein EOO50_01850 [Flavobacterium sp.]